MKRIAERVAAFVAVAGLLAAVGNAQADVWEVVYSEDFSANPGWTTNNSAHYYWETGEPHPETYYSEQIDGSEEFAYKELPSLEQNWRWRLEYDFYPVSFSYPGDTRLSLLDQAMDVMATDAHPMITLDFTRDLKLQWCDIEGNLDVWSIFGQYEDGEWYHGLVDWNPANGTLYARVTKKANGALVGETSVSVPGQFTGIDRIAMCTLGDDYEPNAFGIGYFDNILVSQIPEPATLSLLAVGLGALIVRRRKP